MIFHQKQPLRTKWEQWTGLTEYTEDYYITKKRKQLFLNFLSTLPKGLRVLDVGCYVGDVVEQIHQLGYEGYGIDVWKENIQQAQKSYPHLTFKEAELNKKIPFDDQFFDVIWAGDVIEHVSDTITLFSELSRILKPNGYLVASTPYHGRLKMMAISLVDIHHHFHPEHPHIRFYTNKNLRKILQKYGFSVQKEHYLGRIRFLSNNMFFISRKTSELDWSKVPKTFR